VGILIRRGEGSWQEPEAERYEDEAALQRILVDSPTLLPGIGPAIAVGEFPLGSGSVDVVVIEPSGDLTIVECKLGKNPQVRRAVVGQTLSYAAHLALLDGDAFAERFERRAGTALSERMEALCRDSGIEWDPDAFQTELAARLENGPLRTIIAVDTINDELRTIIEFLNRRTTGSLEVLALELAIAREGDVEVLLPTVFGEESARAAVAVDRTRRQRWQVEDVFDRLDAELEPVMVDGVRRLTDAVVAHGGRLHPGTGVAPSFSAYGRLDGAFRSLFVISLEEGRLGGPTIYLNVGSWSRSLEADDVQRLVAELDGSPGLGWLAERIETRGIGALHRVRLDEVLQGRRFVDTLLDGLLPHLPASTG
jgi:hypothetical protein